MMSLKNFEPTRGIAKWVTRQVARQITKNHTIKETSRILKSKRILNYEEGNELDIDEIDARWRKVNQSPINPLPTFNMTAKQSLRDLWLEGSKPPKTTKKAYTKKKRQLRMKKSSIRKLNTTRHTSPSNNWKVTLKPKPWDSVHIKHLKESREKRNQGWPSSKNSSIVYPKYSSFL